MQGPLTPEHMIRMAAIKIEMACFLPIATPVLLSAHPWMQDRSIHDLADSTIRSEIMELGAYQELQLEFVEPTLVAIPLRTWEPNGLTFFGDGIRVRIETQLYDHPKWVKKVRGRMWLEGDPILGWSPVGSHARMSRLEIVVDGCVVEMPVTVFTDLFDAPLQRDGSLYAIATRSRDGRRAYVHAQVGDGPQARMVTWVISEGRYLYRVVDELP